MAANKGRRYFLIANFCEPPPSRALALVVILSEDKRGVGSVAERGRLSESKNLSSPSIQRAAGHFSLQGAVGFSPGIKTRLARFTFAQFHPQHVSQRAVTPTPRKDRGMRRTARTRLRPIMLHSWRLHRVRAVRDRRASAKSRGDQHRLGDFLFRRSGFAGPSRVKLDAIRALRGERDGDRHQLLILRGDRAGSQGGFVERPERLHRLGGVGIEELDLGKMFHFVHGKPPLDFEISQRAENLKTPIIAARRSLQHWRRMRHPRNYRHNPIGKFGVILSASVWNLGQAPEKKATT